MNNNTSKIEEIIKSSYSQNITVVGQQRKAYDIADETKNAYEITLPPVGFLDFLKGRENELQEVKDMLLQNGKIVGAVTHVLVNDPTRGYGIFIENMLDAAG